MASYANRFGPHNPDDTYVPHAFPEQLVDLGEVQMNHVVVGDASKPALLLIPGQGESWWGYEDALPLLAEHFQCFAVDLRGQTFLGDQWSIGAWDAMREAAPARLPGWMAAFPLGDEPPQNLKEYDPEWGRAFWTGTVAASCNHERLLRAVKVPVLLTHHFRMVSEETGALMGALSDLQANRVRELLGEAGVEVEYRSFETMGHSMHGQDPKLFADTLIDWASTLRS